MAEAFVGLSVLATLRFPYGVKVRGLVRDVAAGQLNLVRVTWLSNGRQQDSLHVDGSNILEIDVEPEPVKPAVCADSKIKQTFVDPAILRYGKPDTPLTSSSPQPVKPKHPPLEPDAPLPFQIPSQSSLPTSSTATHQASVPTSTTTHSHLSSPKLQNQTTTSATLAGPFNGLSLNGSPSSPLTAIHQAHGSMRAQSLGADEAMSKPYRGKRGGRRGKPREGMVSTPTQTSEVDSSLPSVQKRRNTTGNKKGWRQTPILEEPTMANIRLPRDHQGQTPPAPSLTPGQSYRSRPTPEPMKKKSRGYKEEEDPNGWATEEATDIQEMGDFDFEENHKKFDKRKVFDQIRMDDTTADEARLVSFNKLPSVRPGTAGGKNLHYTENVLGSPVQQNVDHSSEDSESEVEEARISSGRSLSRASTRRNAPSRKGSLLATTSFERVASPKLRTDSSTSFRKSSTTPPKSSLRIESSKRSCPCVTPLQMLELEQLATAELGLTEDMMSENAARSISETAYSLATLDEARQNLSPLVVILAGNNKTGSRAIAAARHLRNHKTRTVLCILGLEREEDLLDSVRRQLKIFRNCSGQAINQDALMRTLRKLQSPADLIIDALLGMHATFDDLRTDDQAAYFQLVCWANGSNAATLALDIPSGIDASTGLPTRHDSADLVVLAKHILSLGAPKTGLLMVIPLLKKQVNGLDFGLDLMVADIGLGEKAWTRFGTRKRRGPDFGGDWVAQLVYEEDGQVSLINPT